MAHPFPIILIDLHLYNTFNGKCVLKGDVLIGDQKHDQSGGVKGETEKQIGFQLKLSVPEVGLLGEGIGIHSDY